MHVRVFFSAVAVLVLMFCITASSAAQTETPLYSFTGDSIDGSFPLAGLVFDGEGNLFGTTSYGGTHDWGTAFKLSPPASGSGTWTRKTIHSFDLGASEGALPGARLAFHNDALYGVTSVAGGVNECCGVVFSLTFGGNTGWQIHVLHSFTGADGSAPSSGVIFDAAGNMYGTASQGGGSTLCGAYGCGSVYELSPPSVPGGPWAETVLYTFTGASDGGNPGGELVFDSAGSLYGTAAVGGTSGGGGVFQLTPSTSGAPWTEHLLYSFKGGSSDGDIPIGALAFDKSGNLLGATFQGGPVVTGCGQGCGVLFKLKPPAKSGGAWTETLIHRFGSGNDGKYPSGGVLIDSSGALYGTTFGGGNNFACEYSGDYSGCGTVYKFSQAGAHGSAWTETILHDFGTIDSDGAEPNGGLLFDSKGNLYGTTKWGSAGNECGCGTVFEITP